MKIPVRLVSVLLLAATACQSSEVRQVAEGGDARFDWFRALPGTWVATEDSSTPGLEVEYRLTAGGSVLEETIDPGSDNEMVTMIHPSGQRLFLTHYCRIGNQPRMKAQVAEEAPMKEQVVDFRCAGGTNMTEDEMHMHRAVYAFLSEDHLQSEWTLVERGEMVEVIRMDLIRRQDG